MANRVWVLPTGCVQICRVGALSGTGSEDSFKRCPDRKGTPHHPQQSHINLSGKVHFWFLSFLSSCSMLVVDRHLASPSMRRNVMFNFEEMEMCIGVNIRQLVMSRAVLCCERLKWLLKSFSLIFTMTSCLVLWVEPTASRYS